MEGLGPCEEWQGSRFANGYGRVAIMWRKRRWTYVASRLVFECEHGELGPDEVVRHRCDNPPCVRLSHLERGTPTDNMQDKKARGRWRGGRPRTLRKPMVVLLHLLRDAGLDYGQIARRTGVHRVTVSLLLRGKYRT